jgi:predicted DNA-binding protein with PD1-like motif
MRRLVQPGPVQAERIKSLPGWCERTEVPLPAGVPLAEAIAQPLIAAGVHAATLRIEGLTLDPLRCVMPGPADGPAHVAYFSGPREAAGVSRIDQANVTFGCVDGVPRLHCHAVWTEADGALRGGHVLLDESVVAVPSVGVAWTFRDLGIVAEPDPETNFPLLRPVRLRAQSVTNAVLARVRPNEDVCAALETIAKRHGLRNAHVRGSLGSLVGAEFTDGRTVPDHATEVLVRRGEVRDGTAVIDMAVVDMQGHVHTGRLVRGRNAVCITFDLVLEAVGP